MILWTCTWPAYSCHCYGKKYCALHTVRETQLDERISELKEYDKTCKQKKEQLRSTSELIEKILSEGKISDVNLRMLVKKIIIHQNADKSIDIRIEMNGAFDANVSVFLKSA